MLETYVSEVLSRLMAGKPQRHLAVAVSGGADSMALALLASRWAKKHKRTLTCLTINHGLREGAAKEAAQVADWCRKRKIPHVTLSYEGARPRSNIMEEARNIRYQLLFGWCRQQKAALLVAHNLEDQAETLLLRLQRGSGVHGLACMPEEALRYGIPVLRPLLGVSHYDLEAFLTQQKQPWVLDPTNADPKYARNSLRQALESNPLTREELSHRLFETARAAGRARHALERLTNEAMASAVSEPIRGIAILDAKAYAALAEEVALRLLTQLLSYMGPADAQARYEALYPLHQELVKGSLAKSATLSGCLLTPATGGRVIFSCENKAVPPVPLTKGEPVRFGPFEFHAKKSGVVLKPLGFQGIKAAGNLPSLPKAALSALPSLWKINGKRIETFLWAPHMKEKGLRKVGVEAAYNPLKEREIKLFAYCRAAVYTVG